MDYKKKYEEALGRARQVHTTNVDENKKSTEYIFPELKESEDEKIRKDILSFAENMLKNNISKAQKDKFKFWISWLEKQGEKPQGKSALEASKEGKIDNANYIKPTYKVEPKFHKGDWIINNRGQIYLIDIILTNCYHITSTDKVEANSWVTNIDEDFRLWSIEDAKNGDVLATENERFGASFVAIYKSSCDNNLHFNSHCCIGYSETFYGSSERHFVKNIHPATKEQRELLFTKMEKNGYKWDAENKRIIKL